MDNNKEAMYYRRLENQAVQCELCPHGCKVKEGSKGICRVRKNIEGKLYAQNYGKVSAIAMDPMEKKPLYHYYPGKYVLSIGTIGCNFTCSFCQNYHIAQQEADTRFVEPRYLLNLCRSEEECIGLAYTYNEPNVWFEYILETSAMIKQEGLKNIIVSNGYISQEPLLELLQYTDAMNIDVKAFNEKYYKEICGGTLRDVQKTVETAADKVHIEITTLIVPGYNDSLEEIKGLAHWLSGMNPSIPLHLTRYYPQYKMTVPSTPVETIKRLKEAALEHLDFVYIGNVAGEDSDTYCPDCGALLMRRMGGIIVEHLDEDHCTKCGRQINIIGMD
ncbi:MAG TPA: AmmeMemoRadiSam system radical SAM enzyme [Patescibacteria group bacterium]|nr:AmmeMemoRadiSam system radical SAM enzyme [Patescibacteria group bacterium]